MANKYIWCVEIYVFDVQLGYTNVIVFSYHFKGSNEIEFSKVIIRL